MHAHTHAHTLVDLQYDFLIELTCRPKATDALRDKSVINLQFLSAIKRKPFKLRKGN